MARIFVDNVPYDVDAENNLLDACLSLGFDIPYFCWHPALGAVGACRQCAVKKFHDENDAYGKIVMSCLEPIVEGLRISISDPEVRKFRASVIEWLMLNHPHDCPVCDEGGECHLQDMTVMTGHAYRRTRFRKRTYRNQDLGPFVNHEMNRCIQCFRCVRFYRDFAGGHDLGDFASRDQVFFGRGEDGRLENEFSGNLVEICPTGVFTDKTFKSHFTRKWDLSTAPSVCVHCSLGCNTIPGERYGKLRRVRNRYNGEVNGYFLCDRGRYGYEFVNSERRIAGSRAAGLSPHPDEEVFREKLLLQVLEKTAWKERPIGIGSPRASLEANFALRTLVGAQRFFSGESEREWSLHRLALEILKKGPARSVSLQGASEADAVLVLAEDVTNTAPLLALALRQAVRRKPLEAAARAKIPPWHDLAVRDILQDSRGPLFIIATHKTRLGEVGREIFLGPDEIAHLGRSIAGILRNREPQTAGGASEIGSLARMIARSLSESARPLIVAGIPSGNEEILHAAADIAWALCTENRKAGLSLVFHECNSLGLAMLQGGSLRQAMKRAEAGETDSLIVLENDLYRRAEKRTVDEFLSRFRNIIVLDHLETETAASANIVLSAATYAESEGTLVNNEGRAQRFYKVLEPFSGASESWRWLTEISQAMGQTESQSWRTIDDLTRALSRAVPALSGIEQVAPDSDFRIHGLKIPRQPARASGRTAIHAAIDVSEPKPPEDPDSPLAFSMEGHSGALPPPLIPRFWSPGWNSVQSVNKYQIEVGGPLRGGDPGRRLVEPSVTPPEFYGDGTPAPDRSREGELSFVPIYHIFGSEELSASSASVARLVPEPYVLLNPEDALELNVREGDSVLVELGGEKRILPARLTPDLRRGLAGLPDGLPGLVGLESTGRGKVKGV